MNKYLTLLFSLILWLSLPAQDKYIPTVIENAHWYLFYGENAYAFAHTFRGDTIIEGISYKKLYKQVYHEEGFLPEYDRLDYFVEVKSESILGFYREDTLQRKIHAIFKEPNILCNTNEEFLIFDFNLSLNDTVWLNCLYPNPDYPAITSFIEPDTIYNIPLKKYYFEFISDMIFIMPEVLIEGFGSLKGPYMEIWNGPISGHATDLVEYCVGTDAECISILNGGVNDIRQQAQESGLSIQPNPSSNHINLKLDKRYNKLSFNIYNLQGQLQQQGELRQDGKQEINIERLISGTYFVVLIEGGSAVANSIFMKAW